MTRLTVPGHRLGHRRGAALKRTIDVVGGVVLCVASLPLLVLAALASALALRAWPVFSQVRPGLHAEPFMIVKIRTMPPMSAHFAMKDEAREEVARLPWVCRVLRSTHLDELPQLFLVVVGTMSLVGPRPCLPLQYEHIGEAFEEVRTRIRPGCTGLWQISVAREHTQGDDPEFDLFYLQRRTVRMDLWILARTALFMAHVVGPIPLDRVPRWTASRRVSRVARADAARLVAAQEITPAERARADLV